MRAAMTLALCCVALLGCSSKKGDTPQAQKDAAPASRDAGYGEPGYQRKKSVPAPEVFAKPDSSTLLVASNSTHVYWVERSPKGHTIVGAPKAHGKPSAVSEHTITVRSLVANDSHVYWTAVGQNENEKKRQPAGIYRAPAGGGKNEYLSKTIGVLILGADRLFILDRGVADTPGTIKALPLDGSRTTIDVVVGKGKFGRAAMDLEDGLLVFLGDERRQVGDIKERYGWVRRAPVAGGDATEIASDFLSPGLDLQVSDGFAYFTGRLSDGKRRLLRAPIDGTGKPEAILDPLWEIQRFTVVGTDVYAVARAKNWELVRFDLSSGKGEAVAKANRGASAALFSDKHHVYWAETGKILRVSTQEGTDP